MRRAGRTKRHGSGWRWGAGSVLGAALLLGALPTSAQTIVDGVTVEWTRGAGAETCLDAPELLAALRALGASEGASQPARGRLVGRVDATSDGFRVRVSVQGPMGAPRGERELASGVASCADLHDAIVVIVALMIDSLQAAPLAPSPAFDDGPRTDLGFALGLASGPLPGPAVGGQLSLGYTNGPLWLEAAFTAGLGRRLRAGEGEVQSHRLGARALGCGRVLHRGTAGLGVCGSLQLGRLTFRTDGLFGSNGTAHLTHARAGGALRAYLHVARMRLVLEAGADFALGRPELSVVLAGQPERVHRAPIFSAGLLLGVSVALP